MCGIIIISFILPQRFFLFQSRFHISAIDYTIGAELIWTLQITTVQNRSQTVPSCVLQEENKNILIFDIQFCILEFSVFCVCVSNIDFFYDIF